MIRRPPRSTQSRSSAASDVYKRQYQRRVRGDTMPDNRILAEQEKLMLTHQIEKSPEQQIYELRYTAYLEKASIKENSQHAFMDPYDTAPNCHSFICLLYTSPSPRDRTRYRMPSSA
eukprot:TRINITY_DN3762_c0_g1_i1.p1 TRINITY_DN3762_c0_g1~~TRINITY_DN3762_c0_g1_i1.p1  ORF type:complete len:117 (+),score=42.62 TRINITY_DN3762_c0_g1_i1:128-478(+)